MDIQVKNNRENLYKSLISQGFFVDEDDNPEITLAEFCEQVDDEENTKILYENLVDAEVLVDGNGKPLMTEDEFLHRLYGRFATREYYPITENQRGLFIDWEMHRDTTQYNLPDIRCINGVSAETLREALIKVVNAHAYVKTHFAMMDGDVVQVRCDDAEVQIPIYEIERKPDSAFFQDRIRPFNLLEGPLYRFEIYKTPAGLYLFQDIHHTVNDGFSLLVLQNDIDKVLKGEEIEPELFSYFDHALMEANQLAGEEGKKAQQYFDELLNQKESTAYPHSSENTGIDGFGLYPFEIPSAEIEEFCRQYGMTSNAYFATVLSQILHRSNREESVLFFTIDNGRTDSEVMKTIGMYVKTLPVTSTLNFKDAKNTTFEQAAKAMNSQLIKTVSYSYYPLTMMSERHHIHPEILYVYHGKLKEPSMDDGHDKDISIKLDTVKVPLTVTIMQQGEQFQAKLTFNPALYALDDIKRLASAFKAAALNALKIKSIAEFSMLDDDTRAEVESLRVTCKKVVPWKLYYQPIEENAIKYADRVALIAKDRTLTFAKFNIEANRVAHALIRKGVKRGDRVVLLLPRRSGVIVSMFGVSKAGAAYIPCDPEYPADRINLIMTDSDAQYVITTPDHASDYPAEKVILIDDIYNTGNTLPEDDLNPNLDVSPEDLAYLIYTSGSTGRPKGVMLRHVGIANYLYPHPANIHIQGLLDLGVKSFVSITTLSFDMSLKEFAGSLFNGITSVLADEDEVMDAHLLADLMKRTEAEAINGTCSRILTYMELDAFREALSHCKAVWSGGEKYPMQLLTQLQELGVHIFNTYGPTEITVSSNIADLTHAKKVTVGRPLLNYEEFIVDQFDQQLPIGFVGEMLIGGPGVARGYNNLPEMTAERFTEYNGIRVYRSGDLAKWRPDGDVEILGRNDGQVKLRGFRVELGEIEGIAAKYQGIRQAVADIKEVGTVQHLCLFYTSEAEIDESALKAFLAESLTEYMVPTAYIRIDAIPLTPNGKTNRKALPAPKIQLDEIVAPANETEETLLDLMKSQLKMDELGVTTNLVSVGLSSLAAMRISANLMQKTGQTLATKDIIMNPTVRQLAAILDGTDADELQQWNYDVQEYYPLSENQRGIYIDWDMNHDTTQYNIPYTYKFGKMETEQLKSAVICSVNAHTYLKSRLVKVETDVKLQRRDGADLNVSVIELNEEPGKSYFQNKVRPFNLLSDDLLRVEIVQTPSFTYLFIDIHHIVYDGLSEGVFLGDIFKAYQGKMPEVERTSAFDYALYEDELLNGESYKKAEGFFDNLVGGLNISTYPNSSSPDNVSSSVVDVRIPSSEVNAYCAVHGVTVGSYLQAAFAYTLCAITREEQPLYLTISAGRGANAALMHSVGMFVKTLPVTCKMEKDMDAVDFTQQMHDVLQQTYAQDFYPYTHLVERHGIRAEIMFIYQGGLMEGTAPADAEIVPLDLDTVKFPMDVTAYPDGSDFCIHIDYDGMRYSKSDILTFAKAIGNVAINLTKVKKLSDVSLLSSTDEKEVAASALGRQVPVDMTQTFPSLLIAQAEKTPANIAIADEKGQYIYAELNALTDAVASQIVDLVSGSSPFISIMLGYQKEFLVAAIGIEKAGHAYVPLDYDYPNDRLLYMLEDSESSMLVTSHAIFDEKNANGEFSSYQGKLFFIDDFLADCDVTKYSPLNLAVPDGLAYMIYTSGSTGKPKGVMIPQSAKANFVQFIAREWHHTEKSRICCHSSFSFDASIEDLYPVLTVGGTLYIVPQEARKDMVLLHNFIVDNGITGGCYTTQLGQMLLQKFPDLPVDYLVVGGEKMTAAPECKCRLINTYGPTEFTVDATFYDVTPGKEYRNIPIGRALDNLAAYVVDANGHLVPNGMAGELCMAGPQMAAGYWHREDLTAEKFSEITILGKSVKVYHTGDLVKYNSDGEIEYLGRIDNQVKLRGFRIELGEIETLIGQYEGIKMESVQVKEIGGVQHLCAYYTSDSEIDKDALKSFLAEQLTDYMVPTAYMQLDEMPLTPNGKVNTKALPAPVVQSEELVAPVTKTEKTLFRMATEMLKHNQFGVTSNLITMGLTSLTAMRFTVEAYNEFQVQISVKDVMQNPTIGQLAALIDSRLGHEAITEKQEADQFWAKGLHYYYPITENQRGVFFDWEMNRDTTQYNVPEVHVYHNGDAQKLREAIKMAVDAHPYLKTRFVQHDGDVMQIRRDEEPVEILMETLAEKPDTDFFQSRVRPFNLYKDTLYRFEIYTFGDDVYMFMDIHHTIFDGFSSFFLLEDIQKVYDGQTIEKETYTAFDFALDEYRLTNSEKYTEAAEYFNGLLEGVSTVAYPKSKTVDVCDNGSMDITIEGNAISAFCKEQGVTPNSYFLTQFMHVLHVVTRESDIAVTTINNGRQNQRMLGIMGMFVKTIPVVSSVTDTSKTVAEMVHEMNEQILETQSRDFYPFTKMVELYGLHPQIMFVFQPGGDATEPTEERFALSLNQTKFPFEVIVMPHGDDYLVRIKYDAHLYSRKDMQQFAEIFMKVTEQATSVQTQSSISLLDESEKQNIIALSAGEHLKIDFTKTWFDAFMDRVNDMPEKLAVVDANSSLTYSQLNEESARMGAWLQQKGVGAGDFVCIMLPRIKEFIVSILAIQRIGAAYVPVDFAYPEDRKNYMMSDCEAKVVITSDILQEILNSDTAGDVTLNLSTPEGAAYMIYTSGSTGKPKGVMLHHKGLWNFVESTIKINQLSEDDRISSHRSFSFDAHIEDVFPVLSVGATMYIMPDGIRKDLHKIYNFLIKNEITGGGYTTTVARLLLSEFDLKQRYITCGGEALTDVVSDKVQIINVYGPTECTNHSTAYHLEKGRQYSQIPIGRPLPNMYTFIVDQNNRLVPRGIAGELCVAGVQVGNGYWHLEDKTKEVFVDCPFVDTDVSGCKMRMYHTGDICRWNDEGTLDYLGRKDSQVKLNGFRIENSEIESVALRVSGIRQAIAEVRQVGVTRMLILYYCLVEGESLAEKDLRQYIESSSLAEYMHPSLYILMNEMPTTPSGKVNRRLLPLPQLDLGDIVLPENEQESQLLEIIQELVKNDHIGVTTNLISVGLTSLSAMRLSALVKQKMDLNIPTNVILAHPTIREMIGNVSGDPIQAPRQFEKQDYYPLTENQRGIYIDWEMNRDALQYNMPSVLPMDDMDVVKLCDAIKQVIDHNPYLKTTFVVMNGDIMQKRNDELSACVELFNLDHEPEEGFFQSRVRPFNLLSDCLYRIEVYKTPSSLYLFQDIHHIIFDGGSHLVFLDEILKVYNGEELETATFTAYEHSLEEKELLESNAYSEAEKYFDNLLENAETASLQHIGALNEDRAVKQNAYVDMNLNGTAITSYCKKHGLTANNFFLTVLMQVLHRLVNEQKIAITTICNGRENNNLLRSIGMFVQTLPVVSTKLSINDKHSFAEIAQQMQRQSLETQSRSFYPFTTIVERYGIRPNIMFIYQGGVDISAKTIEIVKQSVDLNVDLDTVKVPIAIMIGDAPEGNFHMNIEYETVRFGNEEMTILAKAIQNFIDNVLNNPETSVTEIPIVSGTEAKDIIESSFGGDLEYNKNETFVDLVVYHAAKRPNAIAVVDGEGSISYGELDRLSDIVASTLIAQGVEKNEFVCVKLPRCKEFLVAVLGVMKAGAAYVPVDKDYPQERIEFMQIDSEAKVMIDEVFMSDISQTKPCTSVNLSSTTGLAYMIYTSGSTGKPKGVMQSHRSLRAFCAWRLDQLHITTESKNAQHASFSFDASLDDLLCPLAAGGEVHILSDKLRLDMDGMRNYFKENGITGLTMSTQMGMAMLNAYNDLPLSYLMMGGEKLLPFQKTPIKVINGYGPTEFTVCSSFHVVNQEKDIDIPIGRAVPNTWSLICDSYGNLLPLGISGELCLAGPQIAEGYWHREDLTEEKFVQTPFCQKIQMYRTGDIARYNAEGELEFMGRIDNMVKLRGFRIELGEIETRASQYKVMKDVAAEVKTVGKIQHLVLYFSASAQVDTNNLREFMAETLTEYMVPTIFMQLESLPLTPNGKINRKALPEPSLSDSVENVAPANEKEGTLLKLAYELLGHEGFGVTDNLMLQGFTSLMGIKLVAMASMQKIVIKLDDLMKQKTIRGVLEHNMTMGFWANMPSPDKPIVVVTCGETPYKNMLPYINALSKQYSVFIIECILEHYDYLFVDANIDEVLEMYYTLLDLNIGLDSDIKVFTGHCFGGEIAYRLANRWKNEHPSSAPKVVMLDVFWRLSTEQSNEEDRQLLDLLPQDFLDSHQEEIAHFNKVHDMYNALNTNDSPAIFDGKLVLFRAMRSEPDSEAFSMLPPDLVKQINQHRNTGRKVDNEAFWRSLYPELECVHVEADHMGMLEESQIGTYVEWINKNI